MKARGKGQNDAGMGFDWHEKGLTVGQVADRMEIAPSAVRWYADQGLLPCERVAGNQRRFFADVLCRVAMIRAAQAVGLTLAEIRETLAELPAGRVPTAQDWERLAARLRVVVNRRIDVLFTLLADLSGHSTAFSAAADTPPPGRSTPTRRDLPR